MTTPTGNTTDCATSATFQWTKAELTRVSDEIIDGAVESAEGALNAGIKTTVIGAISIIAQVIGKLMNMTGTVDAKEAEKFGSSLEGIIDGATRTTAEVAKGSLKGSRNVSFKSTNSIMSFVSRWTVGWIR